MSIGERALAAALLTLMLGAAVAVVWLAWVRGHGPQSVRACWGLIEHAGDAVTLRCARPAALAFDDEDTTATVTCECPRRRE